MQRSAGAARETAGAGSVAEKWTVKAEINRRGNSEEYMAESGEAKKGSDKIGKRGGGLRGHSATV